MLKNSLAGSSERAIKGGKSAAQIWSNEPAKAAQKDTDARWTMKYSKAKPAADGARRIDIAIPCFGYKTISASTTATG
jgi:transposase, IS5 family